MHDFVSSVVTEERIAVVQKREVEGRGIVQEGGGSRRRRWWQTKEEVAMRYGGARVSVLRAINAGG